jgi:hypothetical protein
MRRTMTSSRRAGGAALALVSVVALAACTDTEARPLPMLSGATLAETGGSNPTVSTGANGATYVAWVASTDAGSDVMFSSALPAGRFTPPARVNDIEADAAPHAQAPAQVAAGPGEDVYVLWQNRSEVEWLDFGASDVRFSRSSDGGRTWSHAITVNDNAEDTPARNTFHDMAVSSDGTIIVSWIDARVRDGFRGEVYRETGALPSAEEEPATEIRIARSTDGGVTFSPSIVLETNSCPCCRTSLATGPDGTVYVSYRKVYGDNIRDIAVVRSEDGGQTFGEPVRVHEDNWHIAGCPHAGASLAVDPEGRVHVAWFTGSQENPGAFYAVSEDGARTFSEPTRLTPEGAVATTQVAVAADESGAVWVAWEEPAGAQPRIALARVEESGNLERVDVGAATGLIPALDAADPSLALAWLEGEAVKVLRTAGE